MNKDDKEIMSVTEVARYLGFSSTKIYRLLKADATPARDEFARVTEEPDRLTRNLIFVGLLTREVAQEGIRPVIVGGQAVEFYTAGGYATQDIELVARDTSGIGRVLERWGFRKSSEPRICRRMPATWLRR